MKNIEDSYKDIVIFSKKINCVSFVARQNINNFNTCDLILGLEKNNNKFVSFSMLKERAKKV